jgi:gluconolactonase
VSCSPRVSAERRANKPEVMIFDPEGQPIGRIALPERCANLCFGGRQRNRLFMACGHGLYALYVNAQGAV